MDRIIKEEDAYNLESAIIALINIIVKSGLMSEEDIQRIFY